MILCKVLDNIIYAKNILERKAPEHQALLHNAVFCLLVIFPPFSNSFMMHYLHKFKNMNFIPLPPKKAQIGFF